MNEVKNDSYYEEPIPEELDEQLKDELTAAERRYEERKDEGEYDDE